MKFTHQYECPCGLKIYSALKKERWRFSNKEGFPHRMCIGCEHIVIENEEKVCYLNYVSD